MRKRKFNGHEKGGGGSCGFIVVKVEIGQWGERYCGSEP